jgi:putative redox protein
VTDLRTTTDFQAHPGAPRPPQHVTLTWEGDHRFEGGRPNGVTHKIDASAKTGPSPVDSLLLALASCTSVDVVDILAKRRTPAESLKVDVMAQRAAAIPARVTAIQLTYIITGKDIDRSNAERAIDLAVNKYCSVRDSLDPNMPIDWKLVLNGS